MLKALTIETGKQSLDIPLEKKSFKLSFKDRKLRCKSDFKRKRVPVGSGTESESTTTK